MTEIRVSAEIQPRRGKARAAAQALEARGFRVLHVGDTVSVDAPPALWTDIFGVSFDERPAPPVAGVPSEVNSYYARPDTVSIPDAIHDLVESVSFIEPPEFL